MAQADFFMKIEGVDGEATAAGVENQIDIQSWSWGASNSGSAGRGSGSGSGKVSMQDFHFTMRMNKASPVLMQKCASGFHFRDALLTCRKAGGEQKAYLTIKMTDVLVSSYQTGGSEGADLLPIDQVSMNFAKIEFDYKPQKADGSLGAAVKAGWDLTKGVKT